jgi:hypothetical protein
MALRQVLTTLRQAAEILLARSMAFLEEPPPEGWTGVFAFQSK